MLVVDDNSPDGTGQMAEQLAATNPFVNVLHRSEKDGLGRAYCAGFAWALQQGYEYIMEMDCDFSHDPGDIPRFIQAAHEADLVLGSRYCHGIRVINWPMKRLLLSTGAARYVRAITGMPFTDPTGGYKCFRRRALASIDLDQVRSNGYSFQIEMTHKLWRQGMKVVEIPIIFTDRFHGTSKMSRKIVWEALAMVWRLWLQNGLRRKSRVNNNYETPRKNET
jgi:dolichol-phosphate mannosyltransferase